MVGPGETISTGAAGTCDCGTDFELEVLQSAAGYYIGTTCRNPECEYYLHPNSRESLGYWTTQKLAQEALDSGSWEVR